MSLSNAPTFSLDENPDIPSEPKEFHQPGSWIAQAPNETWDAKWNSMSDKDKERYARETADRGATMRDRMVWFTDRAKVPQAPRHWKGNPPSGPRNANPRPKATGPKATRPSANWIIQQKGQSWGSKWASMSRDDQDRYIVEMADAGLFIQIQDLAGVSDGRKGLAAPVAPATWVVCEDENKRERRKGWPWKCWGC